MQMWPDGGLGESCGLREAPGAPRRGHTKLSSLLVTGRNGHLMAIKWPVVTTNGYLTATSGLMTIDSYWMSFKGHQL